MHPNIYGKPDILLFDSHTLIFLDGCFWHKCPKCFQKPDTHASFWLKKIEKNINKDRKTNRKLRREGWKVVRIWEHEIRKSPEKVFEKIKSVVKNN